MAHRAAVSSGPSGVLAGRAGGRRFRRPGGPRGAGAGRAAGRCAGRVCATAMAGDADGEPRQQQAAAEHAQAPFAEPQYQMSMTIRASDTPRGKRPVQRRVGRGEHRNGPSRTRKAASRGAL